MYCSKTNMRSNDEDKESFHINRKNPIISLCELQLAGKINLHFNILGFDVRLKDEKERGKALK